MEAIVRILKLICLRLFFQLLCSHSFQSAHTHASACFFICNKLNTFSDEFTMRDRFQILVILCKRHKRWNNRHRHTKCITIYGSSILFLFECTEIVYRETDGARANICVVWHSQQSPSFSTNIGPGILTLQGLTNRIELSWIETKWILAVVQHSIKQQNLKLQ